MSATDAVRDLLTAPVRDESRGFFDVLPPEKRATTLGLRAMQNPALAAVYERFWRPAFTRLFSGGGGGTARADDRLLGRLVAGGSSRRILDVACGPGTHTRRLASGLTDGLCVGLDFSVAMLTRAVADNAHPNAVYLRADAHRIPFPDHSFDAVTCLAALYLMPDPMSVLDEMARVVAPGGELAVFTTLRTRASRVPGVDLPARLAGMRIFGPDEVTGRFEGAGLLDVRRADVGQGQYVTARAPDQNER